MTGDPGHGESRKTIDLEEFLRILPFLESPDLMSISAAYEHTDQEAREEARRAASVVAGKRRLTNELGRIQGSIIQWAGSNISQSAVFTFESVSYRDRMLGDLRVQAVPPLLDAATALLLGGSLDERHAAILMEPWSSTIG